MRKEQNYKWDGISLGVCYYPEHWDPSIWREDLRRMKANGIGTVRIGEFAWSKVEPREGEFTYEFFDSFLELAQEEQMKVIFGTPTATPPAWLTEKYPEVLNCRKDGAPLHHGMRRHYNYNSPKYQELSARIVEKIAQHYAGHPCVVGWQIDNEFNCEENEFYSKSDDDAFRAFLMEKYTTLDALNENWGTAFWNQTYTDWREVHIPRTTISDDCNPHQKLDYIRFISQSTIRFCKMQSEILRKYKKPGDFITTNGLFGHLDNHRMMDECLDVYTYDSYPNFAFALGEDPKDPDNLNDRRWSRNLSETRSVCRHFGIMEQQSGANGWVSKMEAPAPKPGQMMLWAMQSIAHGADYVSFFRWRTANMGTEMYWHGILDYDSRDNRKLEEVNRIWRRTQAISAAGGAAYVASFGLLKDYDNLWDTEADVWHGRLAWQSEQGIFAAAQLSHTPMDMVYLTDSLEARELEKYRVLVYPHPVILDERRAALLKQYVESGGTLIIGARAGQKEICGRCASAPMPGPLADLTGTDVREFTLIGPADDASVMEWDGKTLEAGIFSDVLALRDGQDGASPVQAESGGTLPGSGRSRVLAVYGSNYYKGEPALIETRAGKGRVLHFGGTFTRQNALAFLEYTKAASPWSSVVQLPEDCELAVRAKGSRRYLFVLNYTKENRVIRLERVMTDLDTAHEVQGEVTLPPYGTKVYEWEEQEA